MKKTLIVLLLTITISPCFSRYSLGVKGGIHYKKISDNVGVLNTDFHFGYEMGLFGKIGITNKISIQPELLISRQLYSLEKDGMRPFLYRLRHITLPVLAIYKLYNNKTVSINTFLGIEFNHWILDDIFWFPDLWYGKPVIFGPSCGVGLDIYRFTFDIRYSYGYALNPEHELYKNLKINNHYIKMSTGWKFLNNNYKKNI